MPNVLYELRSPYILDYNCQFSTDFLRIRTNDYHYEGYYIVEIKASFKRVLERIISREKKDDSDNFSKAGLENLKRWHSRMSTRFDPIAYLDDANRALGYYVVDNEIEDEEYLRKQVKQVCDEIKEKMFSNKEKITDDMLYKVIDEIVYNKEKQVFDLKNV